MSYLNLSLVFFTMLGYQNQLKLFYATPVGNYLLIVSTVWVFLFTYWLSIISDMQDKSNSTSEANQFQLQFLATLRLLSTFSKTADSCPNGNCPISLISNRILLCTPQLTACDSCAALTRLVVNAAHPGIIFYCLLLPGPETFPIIQFILYLHFVMFTCTLVSITYLGL